MFSLRTDLIVQPAETLSFDALPGGLCVVVKVSDTVRLAAVLSSPNSGVEFAYVAKGLER